MPADPTFSRYWRLEAETDFLNHGSFGACPLPVLQAQDRLREQMEQQPVRFLGRELEPLLARARAELGPFLSADPDDLAFVDNATTGVNTVVRSLRFSPGDELLVTDQAYNACRNALEAVALWSGARVTVAQVPFPLEHPSQVTQAVLAAVTAKTKLLLLDHVTSPTGIVWPVAEIVRALNERGVDTLVDGAHAPGMVPLSLEALGAAYYTGNCHKWLCAPKGAAFLYVRRDRQERIRPLTISHGANSPRRDMSRFRLEFDWTGTRDFSPFLCIPEAIRFLGSLLPGGWDELMRRNRERALEGRRILCDALGVQPPCPEEMVGSLAAVRLPDGGEPPEPPLFIDPLQTALWERYRIEVPIFAWPAPPVRWVRVSAQVYNTPGQYHRLASALRELLAR